jgi:hypothetical protein
MTRSPLGKTSVLRLLRLQESSRNGLMPVTYIGVIPQSVLGNAVGPSRRFLATCSKVTTALDLHH